MGETSRSKNCRKAERGVEVDLVAQDILHRQHDCQVSFRLLFPSQLILAYSGLVPTTIMLVTYGELWSSLFRATSSDAVLLSSYIVSVESHVFCAYKL